VSGSVRAILGIEAILAMATIVGLVHRGRWRSCWSFLGYALTVVVRGVSAAFWPDAQYTWQTWMMWQTLQVALKLAVLFELGTYIFRPFPGALAAVRGVIVTVLMATVAALLSLRIAGTELSAFALRAGPIANQGTAWGCALLLALSTWYFVPMDTWRRAILIGMATYGMLFTVAMAALERWGTGARDVLSYLNMGAYVVLLGYWNLAAWRPPVPEDDDVDRLRQEIPLRLAARGQRP
jgi:hypothetical protein